MMKITLLSGFFFVLLLSHPVWSADCPTSVLPISATGESTCDEWIEDANGNMLKDKRACHKGAALSACKKDYSFKVKEAKTECETQCNAQNCQGKPVPKVISECKESAPEASEWFEGSPWTKHGKESVTLASASAEIACNCMPKTAKATTKTTKATKATTKTTKAK